MAKLDYQNGEDYGVQHKSALDVVLGPDRRRVWRAFAREVGGTYSEYGVFASSKIVTPVYGIPLEMRRVRVGGTSGADLLQLRARYPDPGCFHFSLARRHSAAVPDPGVTTGNDTFDSPIRITSRSAEFVRRVFSNAELRVAVLRADVRTIRWDVRHPWFGRRGESESILRIYGDGRDVEELRFAFDAGAAGLQSISMVIEQIPPVRNDRR